MAQKKKNLNNKTIIIESDKAREKWGKISFYTLIFLVIEIFVCLLFGWLSGNKESNAIGDNFVTGMLQNYNYILGSACLVPVIFYLYSKIKKKLNEKMLTDSQMLLYGFFGVIIVLITIISVCSIVYPINSSTWYGKNSKVTVGIFLCPVIILVLEAILLGILYIPELIKNKTFWKSVRKNLPIILMVMFLIWTFISCMLAPGAADDVIGAEKAKSIGAKPDDVLAKTLNGCYNLKDGFWAFLMYGSVMLAALLMDKNIIKEKKMLIKGFVVVILLLSILTLSLMAYGNYLSDKFQNDFESYKDNIDEFSYSEELTQKDFQNYAISQTNLAYTNWYIYAQRAVFRNSNHFAYVLCMAVIAAIMLAITEKNFYEKIFYIFSFSILTYMLIVNDTFGGYLGVAVALISLFIYSVVVLIASFINSKDGSEESKFKRKNAVFSLTIILIAGIIFTGATFTVKNENGTVIAVRNIQSFTKDIKIFGGYMITEENATQADVNSLDESVTKAGSGRGETWLKVWELVKQRPLFGYGLECLLFQFSGQFDINEGRTHNLVLQLLGTVGIPGTLMYLSGLGIIFIRLIKNWKTWDDIEKICTFVGVSYMVTALTGNSTYYTSPYFMMFLGFVALTPWKREQK